MANNWHMEAQRAEESLRTYLHDRPYNSSEPYLCPICLLEVEHGQVVSEFQCGGKHLFHPICIRRWVVRSDNQYKNCPYCKQWPPDSD